MDYNQRLLFYLGADKHIPHPNMNQHSIHDLTSNVNTHDTVYDVPLKQFLVKTNNQNKRFSFTRGDVISNNTQNNWSLSKNRSENNNSAVILKLFNENRHWGLYYNKPRDIPFENKKNIVFWRGCSTGSSQHFNATTWQPRKVNRFVMIEKWFNKTPYIDVGFSLIHRNWLKDKYGRYLKGPSSPSIFLTNKYLLSIEGNDKDSGLNWKLNSNSLVLMPKPRVTTWLMETNLIPNFHYLLLNDDFSDLHEKYIWCNNNQQKCKDIINNANLYMKQFENKRIEEQLQTDVINKYFELKDKFI